MTDDQQIQAEAPEEFIGHGPAGEYLGIKADTLSGYIGAGEGPRIDRREPDRHYLRPVFLKRDLDAWRASRPGRGARLDLPAKDVPS